MKKYKVAAVVVAYNNSIELKMCLEKIMNQSFKIDYIICIDNSNAEITEENAVVINELNIDNTIIHIINHSENKSSGKGYEIGMKTSMKYSIDFVWLNDQDGLPDTDCLRILLQSFEINYSKPGIYAPQVLAINGGYPLENFRCDTNNFLHGKKHISKQSFEVIDRAGTTGILVNSTIMKKCGVYNGDIFYVGLEDIEYCLRIKKAAYEVFLVKNAVYYHPDLSLKYNKKIVKNYNTFLEKLIPFNFGVVTKRDIVQNNKRAYGYCRGSSYINELYASPVFKSLNIFFSFLRLLIKKATNKDVSFTKTYKLYLDGIKKAKETRKGQRIDSF